MDSDVEILEADPHLPPVTVRGFGKKGKIDLIDFGSEEFGEIVTINDDDECTKDDSCVIIEDDERANLKLIRDEADKQNKPDYNRLPSKAIYYDYTTQPVGVSEKPRQYYPLMNYVYPAFRRPIIVDGIGFVNACIRCEGRQEYRFPLQAIIRCLFHWISKAHCVTLVFPEDCNPVDHEIFAATEDDRRVLMELRKYGISIYCKGKSNFEWFTDMVEERRACLVTTPGRWNAAMPSEFKPHSRNRDSLVWKEHSPWNIPILQPFISHGGLLVFFSPLSSPGRPLEEMLVIKEVKSMDEYTLHDRLQPLFTHQAIQLKVLHSALPKDKRARESSVMIEVIKRLEPFLPGGSATVERRHVQ